MSVLPLQAEAFSWGDVFIWPTNHYIEIIREAEAKEPLTPEEYLKEKADREVTICGYSTKKKCRKVNLADQLSVIIKSESGWGTEKKDYSICNKKYGCGSGQGLIQLIVSTANHCSKKLEREIKREDPYDSIDCGIYLLEEEGIQHWDPWSGPY